MRGIAGRQTRGLPTAARLHVADNTGAKIVQIVNILKLGGKFVYLHNFAL